MKTEEAIREFLDEQFKNTSQFFLYKDKQLLKEGKFEEYAREQINKANKIFWSILFSVFIFSWYGITSLIEYGAGPNWFDLILGITAWLALIVIMVYSTKEYYTIKSSMSMLIKLIKKNSSKTIGDSNT